MAGVLPRVKAEVRDGKPQVVEKSRPCERSMAVLEHEERRRGVSLWWADEAKRRIGALDAAHARDDQGGAKAERVRLGGREEEDGIVVMPRDRSHEEAGGIGGVPRDLPTAEEAGKGDGEGGGDDLPVPGAEGRRPREGFQDGAQEGKGDR